MCICNDICFTYMVGVAQEEYKEYKKEYTANEREYQ